MFRRLPLAVLLFVFIDFLACQPSPPELAKPVASSDSSDLGSHPDWSYQACIYEVNLRQYSSQGNFKAFEKSLPRLRDMGVDILWFMPIHPIGVIGRKDKPGDMGSYYAVKNYYAVNPDYGSMEDWKDLVKKAQDMGFHVILDWVPNHSAPDNPWITTHPDFYEKDSTGKPKIPYDWSDTRQLNYDNPDLRDSMMAAMEFWLKETHIDGFRCDVAWHVPDSFWKTAIARFRKIRPVFMLAEGDLPALHVDGFDATYAWNIMALAYGIHSGKTTLYQLDSAINHNDSIFPKNAFRMYFTTNHDENSFNGTEFERFGEGYKTFAIWTFTMGRSVPLIYSGQEEPNLKRLKFFVKDTIQWKNYGLASFYKTLSNLRHTTPALAADASYTKLKTGNDRSIFAYQREKEGRKLTVLLNFSGKPQKFKIQEDRVKGRVKNVFDGTEENLDLDKVYSLKPWGWLVYDYPKR
jgi:alpha-amylase